MTGIGYTVLGPATLEALHDPRRDFAYDVLVGLSEKPKRLPSKYIYDDEGSQHFSRIMSLDEYYPTRCETEVLERYADEIVAPLLGGGPINPVHTEYSYKYLRSDVEALAHDTGFEVAGRFEDSRGWFLDALWRVKRGGHSVAPRA